MERVRTREDVELLFEYWSKTDIAGLVRINCNVLVAHAPFLIPEFLRVFRVIFNIVSKVFDFLLVVVEALAEVLFHIFNFGVLGEQVQQVLHFEHIPLIDDLECFLNVNFLPWRANVRGISVELSICSLRVLIIKEILRDLDPELFLDLVL